jgi:hypothetical protein
LNAVRQAQPDKDTQKCLTTEPLTEAERYRMVHHMITCPREEGGADIIPKYGDWKNVESVFPLHNHKKNQQWLNEFTRKTFLNPQDLDHIRDSVGEKVGNQAIWTTKGLTCIDRILLCLPNILFHVHDVSSGFRIFVLDLVATILRNLCHCEWTLVRSVRRVVEASGI